MSVPTATVGTDMVDLLDRVIRYTTFESDCWEWQGARSSKGYGRMSVGPGTLRNAHRVVYELLVESVPTGLYLDHLCRNRACVNPDHLEVVTNRENIRRGVSFSAVNARKTHCPQGHLYDEANTHTYRGSRYCRICRRAMKKERRARGARG